MWVPSRVGLAGNSASDIDVNAALLLPVSNLAVLHLLVAIQWSQPCLNIQPLPYVTIGDCARLVAGANLSLQSQLSFWRQLETFLFRSSYPDPLLDNLIIIAVSNIKYFTYTFHDRWLLIYSFYGTMHSMFAISNDTI